MSHTTQAQGTKIPKELHIQLFAELDLLTEGWSSAYTPQQLEREKERVLLELEQKFKSQYHPNDIEATLLEYYKYNDLNFARTFIHGTSELELDHDEKSALQKQLIELRKSLGPRRTRNPNPILDSYRYETYRYESDSSKGSSSKVEKLARTPRNRKYRASSQDRPSCKVIIPRKHPAASAESSTLPALGEIEPRQTDQSTSTGYMNEYCRRDIDYYRKKYERMKKAYDDLTMWQRQNLTLSWQENDSEVPLKFQRLLDEKNLKIASLRQQIELRKSLDNPQMSNTESEDIRATFDDMKTELASICLMSGLRKLCDISLEHITSDQEMLLQAIFGHGSSAHEIQRLELAEEITGGHIVQSLTGAFICRCIFEEPLEDLSLIPNALTDEYRSHIKALTDDVGLENSDYVAHKSLINKEHFQEQVIPRTARKHTERLLGTMYPFIVSRSRGKITKRLRSRLERTLKSAVKLKALMMSTKVDGDWQIVWPLHKGKFDMGSMELDSEELSAEKGIILLPLVPGIQVGSDVRMATSNSNPNAQGKVQNTKKSRMVIKAVVSM